MSASGARSRASPHTHGPSPERRTIREGDASGTRRSAAASRDARKRRPLAAGRQADEVTRLRRAGVPVRAKRFGDPSAQDSRGGPSLEGHKRASTGVGRNYTRAQEP